LDISLLVRGTVFLLLLGRISSCGSGGDTEVATPLPATQPLRVLYAGDLGTPRADDFLNFLEQHFAEVEKTSVDGFDGKDAGGFDTVILDYGGLRIVNNRIVVPELRIGDDYDRPTLTLGATGALISGRLNLKTGYL
jgi:hypothetical protein